MKVLVIGSGGREHALAYGIQKSASLDRLFVMPGNAGTDEIADNVPGNPENPIEVLEFVKKEKIDLVVVGPELPLVLGLADLLREENKLVFGPSSDAARIEGSKAFAKELMVRYKVPTGKARVFSDFELARAYIERLQPPIVIKADGLAAGKGVIIAKNHEDAVDAAYSMLIEKKFGDAGKKILVEEFLEGEEVSFFILSDGKELMPLTSAQDYKRAYDKDEGPNTGGMGSYAPCPWMENKMIDETMEKIFEPIIYALKKEGCPYQGVLYGGLIRTNDNYLKVLEFNCRFGDPEAQVIVPLIEGDFLGVLASVAEGDLKKAPKISFSHNKAVTVVLASGGYPENYRTGFEISGLEKASSVDGVIISHAGTRKEGGKIVTSGGRVLNVTAIAPTFAEARKKAYEAASYIFFENMHFRKDIAERVVHY